MDPFLTHVEIKIRREALTEMFQSAHDARQARKVRRVARRRKREATAALAGTSTTEANVFQMPVRPQYDDAA